MAGASIVLSDCEDEFPSVVSISRTSSSIETSHDLDPKGTKKRKIENEKEKKRLEREQKKAKKQQQDNLMKAMKKVESESRKEMQPGERVKQMIVVLETSIAENSDLMTALMCQLLELNVQYQVQSMLPCGTVRWKRKTTRRSVTDEGVVLEHIEETDEDHTLIILSGDKFLELVQCSKQDQIRPLPLNSLTLLKFVNDLQTQYPSNKVILVVDGVELSLRAQKKQKNQKFRAAVRSHQLIDDASYNPEVTRIDCEEAIVSVQIATGCCVKLCQNSDQIANIIVTYTKALSELPYYSQKESSFSFHGDLGPGASRKELKESSNKVGLIWQHQLMQFPGVSNTVAAAITASFPSPAHLLKAYKNCETTRQAELLLENIQIRRGVGVTASTRRVGTAISKRIHLTMTSQDTTTQLN